ncbi:acyl carrier protein, partial [Vibrio cholerae]|nr:acyl carrier protein [Vibrio cholerae O1]HBN6833969.1 acyl carrier protein [Vibrio cholerae]
MSISEEKIINLIAGILEVEIGIIN